MESWGELLSSEESSGRPFRWRPVAIAGGLIVLLLMAIFLPPLLNLGKYRRSITASMSEALGRPVYVGGMQLRLLPMPGIVMTDFTVDEDPAFGFEPALHANSVVADLRLTSLWRGRLEVSRISLDEVNLNLVRNRAGQWSIGSILLRASQIPNAPTGNRHVTAHPRFPYIEATSARIDFKDGAEKKPFSLVTAEFSMWQASDDEWRLRLRAQPVRTDLQLHLYDTGELNVEGSLRRAPRLEAMPVDLHAEWSGAQLGQVTRLIAGVDSGWRGDLRVTATMQGNLGDLNLQSRIRVSDLRRQEFQPPSTVDVDANCRSQYHRTGRLLDNITCFWPVAAGHLLLTGSLQGFASPRGDLQLEMNQIPASFPVTLLGLMRPGAQNVTVAGLVNGSFHLVAADRRVLSGDATATGVSLRYYGGAVALPPMHFVSPPPQPPPTRGARHVAPPSPPLQNAIQLLPISIPMGESAPLIADARFTRAGFEMHLAGPAALSRLLPAVANFGLLENSLAIVAPKGRATLDLTTTANWMRPLTRTTSGIGTNGTISMENAQLKPPFLPAPVDVESAQINLTPDEIAWQNVALTYRKMSMRGSIQFPTSCNQTVACPATFTLAPGPLTAAGIETALGAGSNGFFGQLIDNALGNRTSAWPTLQGQIRTDSFLIGRLPLRDVAITLGVEGNQLTLSALEANALGGTLHGSGEMRFENNTPHWKLGLRVTGAKAGEAAAVFGEQWGSGAMSGETNLTMTGFSTDDLASSAAGDFSFSWQNGALATAPGQTIEAPFTQFDRWTAKGTIAKQALTLASGGIARAARTSNVRGNITFDRDLNLTLESRRGPVKIAGTLAHPNFGNAVTAK
ncbi:MAG TPA: AsmA family protein [Acidobacteriaceae bacterium]|jgi:hypothetical protein|nr:AsmA family protein [Acidobacteriaceae bacterium]